MAAYHANATRIRVYARWVGGKVVVEIDDTL
jgi:signal transduction histidine kinase